jgi:predicted membrane channel-forming protein YqfA (hemolysin III family)
LNLPLGALVFALCAWQIPSRPPILLVGESISSKIRQIDFGGILLIAGSTTTILYAANAGGVQVPWISARILGCFAAGTVALLAFVVYEIKIPAVPVIPMHLFNRNVTSIYIQQFTMGLAFFLILFETPLYLQLVHGQTALISVRGAFALELAIDAC